MTHNNVDQILNYQQFKNEQIDRLKEKHKKEENHTFSPEINKNTDTFLKTKVTRLDTNDDDSNVKYLRPFDIEQRCMMRLLKIKKLEESIYNSSFTPTVNSNFPIESKFEERQERFKKRQREHSDE